MEDIVDLIMQLLYATASIKQSLDNDKKVKEFEDGIEHEAKKEEGTSKWIDLVKNNKLKGSKKKKKK